MSKTLTRQQLQAKEDYKYLFKSYLWELTLTCRLPPGTDIGTAQEQLVCQVLKPLSVHLKQKIGAISVVVPAHFENGEHKPAHIHALLLSYEGNLIDKIEEIQEFLADNLNPDTLLIDLHSCRIKSIDTPNYYKNATDYLAENLVSVDDTTLNHFKKKLLEKRTVKNVEAQPAKYSLVRSRLGLHSNQSDPPGRSMAGRAYGYMGIRSIPRVNPTPEAYQSWQR